MKECSVRIKRLSKHVIRESTIEVDEIKIENHDDLNADIYNDFVSNSLNLLF